ncbi:MAG: hypothetical protein ABSE63_17005, partial [Thermoguttaceae bacterium]
MKKNFCSLLSVALVLSILSTALPLGAAAELKPVLVVSFAGYSELTADMELIGKLGDKPEIGSMWPVLIAEMVKNILKQYDMDIFITDLIQKKPIGAVVLSDGSEN